MKTNIVLFALWPLCVTLSTGCTFFKPRLDSNAQKMETTNVAIANESKVMVTGALDSLHLAPTNPPVTLAKTLLTRSQELTGLPPIKERLDVQAILATNLVALRDLEKRMKNQEQLVADRDKLQAENEQLKSKLVDMGAKYEEERNKGIVKRMWHWGLGTFGLAGTIAFIIFCPAVAIPLLGRLLGFMVSAIPSIAGFIGVVSHKVLDTTVQGVSNFKQAIANKGMAAELKASDVKEMLKIELRQAQDQSHVDLIDARRAALATPKTL